MKHPSNSSELLLIDVGTNLARCLYMLGTQANLRSGEKIAIVNVLKDWRNLLDVLNQPTPKTEPKGVAK